MAMPKPPEDGKPAFVQTREVNVKLIIGLVISVLALIFVLQNSKRVDTQFLFFEVRVRLWVGLLTALVIGAVIGQLVESWWDRRKRERKQAKDNRNRKS